MSVAMFVLAAIALLTGQYDNTVTLCVGAIILSNIKRNDHTLKRKWFFEAKNYDDD